MEDFKIFNYYPTKDIKLTSAKWSKTITNGNIETVPSKKAAELFAPGSFVEIFLSSAGGERATRVEVERATSVLEDIILGIMFFVIFKDQIQNIFNFIENAQVYCKYLGEDRVLVLYIINGSSMPEPCT